MNQDIYFTDNFNKEIRVGDLVMYVKSENRSYAKGKVHSIAPGKNGFYNVIIECLVGSYKRRVGDFTKPLSTNYVFKLEL
jgi:hypothetical protein